MTRNLIDLQNKFKINTDKQLVNRHTYLEVYDKIFEDIKDEDISILEIGILVGESLKLWFKYFINGKIYGIDIFKVHSKEEVLNNLTNYDRINLDYVDSFQESDEAVESRENFFKKIGNLKFNIIIDDGAHTATAQIKTYNNFKHLVSDGGIYIIEDIRDWCVKHSPGCNCSASHLSFVEKAIPELEIINMNENVQTPDNIMGYYYNE